MISFVSTYPPMICGIGTYTKYLMSHIPKSHYKVVSFRLDDCFLKLEDQYPPPDEQVDYCLSYPPSSLGANLEGNLIWFQHSFGIWGEISDQFLALIEEAKRKKKRVGVSFHTIHFQAEETSSGMAKREFEILSETDSSRIIFLSSNISEIFDIQHSVTRGLSLSERRLIKYDFFCQHLG